MYNVIDEMPAYAYIILAVAWLMVHAISLDQAKSRDARTIEPSYPLGHSARRPHLFAVVAKQVLGAIAGKLADCLFRLFFRARQCFFLGRRAGPRTPRAN